MKNRQNLVNKMSDALSIKYSNFFQAANYDTQTLKDDIGKLLSTQYYSKDPRDVFKPIEQNILDIVKQKNPNLQVKIKKARKLPEIKYTKDKYQEADEAGKSIEEKCKNVFLVQFFCVNLHPNFQMKVEYMWFDFIESDHMAKT